MSSVDSRIVTMKFENTQFQQGVTQSMSALDKLKQSMNFSGATKGLSSISSFFSKFTIKNPFDAAQKGMGVMSGMFAKFGLLNPFAKSTQGAQTLNSEFGKVNTKNPFGAATAGASELQRSVNGVTMSSIEGGITSVNKSFLAMATIAITALSNITTKALSMGANFAKGFTISPILDGLHEYETNLQSIQTIQANTDQPLTKINASLDELNRYSDLTIYNFSEMAKNIGTFTAAGVDLKTATSSIKGIANMAALSGSSSAQAATAMYQLSQAISSGKVGLQDWNSVVNAGMGGKKLQNALAQTAIAMGGIKKSSVALSGPMKKLTINGESFRESIMAKPGEKGWLTSDVLVNTLATLDGRFSKAALSAEKNDRGLRKYSDAQVQARIATARTALEQKNGVKFSDAQFKSLMKLSDSSFAAATQVKTLGQVFDVAKETVGSGWSASFRNIFGGFGQAKKTFTEFSGFLNNAINESARKRNEVLDVWNRKGGRTAAIDGIKNAFKALMSVVNPIKAAFRDIFPRQTGASLIALTKSFRDFAAGLTIGKESAENLRRTFRGVFAIFSIIGQVIGGVIGMFANLFGSIAGGDGAFLKITGGLGDFLVAVDQALRKGSFLNVFFNAMSGFLYGPVRLLRVVASLITQLFQGFNKGSADGVKDSLSGVSDKLAPLASFGEKVKHVFASLGAFLQKTGGAIGKALGGIGTAIADSFSAENFTQVLDIINVALLGGIVLMIKSFFGKGVKLDLTGGLLSSVKGAADSVTETFGAVTTSLKSMQQQVKADILIKIAIALGLLTASIVVLSTIDPKKLAKSMTGLALGFAGLTKGLTALSSSISILGSLKLPFITASLILLGAAMIIFATALKIIATIPYQDLVKGLAAVAILLAILVVAMGPMSKNSKGMIRAGVGLIAVGIGLRILVNVIQQFAQMSLQDIAKGIGSVAAALVIIGLAIRTMPNMLVAGAGLLLLSIALKILGSAVLQFANMNLEQTARGVGGIAAALIIIAGAMRLMPKNMMFQAIALVLVANALKAMASAILLFGGMSMEEIAKGLSVLAASLAILAGGLYLMTGSLMGSAALVVAVAALWLLVPVLLALGAMSWEMIIKSMTALALTFTILGVAGFALAPVVPIILLLSVALLAVGAGMLLAGAGALAFAAAFAIFAATGMAGVVVLMGVIRGLISLIPFAMTKVGEGIIAFANTIRKGAPVFIGAMVAIVVGMLNAVIRIAPKIGQAFMVLLRTGLSVISRMAPMIANAGLRLIVGFLNAIRNNISPIISIAASIIVKFINGIANNIGRIIQAGVNLIIKFVNGVSSAIDRNSYAMGQAGARLAFAIIRGMANGIRGGLNVVTTEARNLASSALNAAKNFLGINSPSKAFHDIGQNVDEGFAKGIGAYSHLVHREVEAVGRQTLDRMSSVMSGLSDTISGDVDMNPVITPILDLTQLAQDATKIGTMLPDTKLTAGVSFDKATSISADRQSAQTAASSDTTPSGGTVLKFEQTNISPKPLSATEIYRNTKSLVSTAKEALNV